MLALPNGLDHRRIGVTASTRVGNAVVRNRVRRRIREIFRKDRNVLPQSIDLVVIARTASPGARMSELVDAFHEGAAMLGARLETRG